MNNSLSVQHLAETGQELMLTKYFSEAMTTFVLYEYLLTLSDEYAWGGRKSWIFYLFLYNRYTPIVFKICTWFSSHNPGYTQEICNKTAFLALVFIVTTTLVSQIFLTVRLYALLQQPVCSLAFPLALSLGQLILGLIMVGSPSNSGMDFPDVSLDAFHLCVVKTKAVYEVGYAGFWFAFDLAMFAMIAYYAISSKSRYGMPDIVKTIFKDTTFHFFVMALCHVVLALSVIFAKTTFKLLPATAGIIFMPVLTSRLVLSLRKAANPEPDVEWLVDHFTARIESPSVPHSRSTSIELQSRARLSVSSRRLD